MALEMYKRFQQNTKKCPTEISEASRLNNTEIQNMQRFPKPRTVLVGTIYTVYSSIFFFATGTALRLIVRLVPHCTSVAHDQTSRVLVCTPVVSFNYRLRMRNLVANMSHTSDSPLLRCLAQLNDDVWEDILLPKLLADGSAPAAALTCSRLRQLCQRSRQQLKLTSLDSADTATVRRWTEQLPQRFPACSSVVMRLCEIESFPAAPVIVDVLSRQVLWKSVGLMHGPFLQE
jgi:hypothetical protein